MNKTKLAILPKVNNPLYEERETGLTHSPFELELELFTAIKNGDEPRLKNAIQTYIDNGFVIGNMTGKDEKNIIYWAIATVSTATHYAILGGLDETDAYNMSDKYLQDISMIHDFESCLSYLQAKGLELVRAVKRVKAKNKYSKKINECIHFIHIHLHEKITIDDLANTLTINRDYLSTLFKKETGKTIHSYIIEERINASLDMIKNNMSYTEIAYTLCFCSQTHFITSFKKIMKMTPRQYKAKYII